MLATLVGALSALVLAQNPGDKAEATKAAGPQTTADVVTLKDGKVVLGQLADAADRRGPILMIVRRDWAEANVPEHAAEWRKVEAPQLKRAEGQRLARLTAWRKGRVAGGGDDRIGPWLDAEVARLEARKADPEAKPDSVLMVVRLNRSSVKAVDNRSERKGRLLRIGWRVDVPDVESMSLDNLTSRVEDRGFSPTSTLPVSVDDLLPIPVESDEVWAVRRACTELANQPGGRLVMFGSTVMAEPKVGEALQPADAMGALSTSLKQLLGEPAENPLPARFRELAAQGRTGGVVTRLEMSPDMTSTSVESVLWVSPGGKRPWVPEISKVATVRLADIAADAGAPLAEDPQVKAALGLVESLGLGRIDPEIQRKGLNMGAATQKALAESREALARVMGDLAISLEPPHGRKPSAAGDARRPDR